MGNRFSDKSCSITKIDGESGPIRSLALRGGGARPGGGLPRRNSVLGLALAGLRRQPIREIGDGARIDIRFVPLLDDGEIAGPRPPGLAAPPAIALQVVRRGGE